MHSGISHAPQAAPRKYTVDPASFIYLNNGDCGACQKFYPADAFTMEMRIHSKLLVGFLAIRFAATRRNSLRSRSDRLARPVGLEPTTPRFEAWCSIQLSYGCGAAGAVYVCVLQAATKRLRTGSLRTFCAWKTCPFIAT